MILIDPEYSRRQLGGGRREGGGRGMKACGIVSTLELNHRGGGGGKDPRDNRDDLEDPNDPEFWKAETKT